MITSSSNNKIKQVIQLKKKAKARAQAGLFLVEGIKMVEEARNVGLQEVFVSESREKELVSQHGMLLQNLSYEVVSDKLFGEMSDTVTPQGILATVKMPSYTIEEILQKPSGHVVLLENLRDPGNLGTIIRSAEGAGATGVILSKECADIFNPKVTRSTMGSIFRVPFCYVEDFIETLWQVKNQGFTLYAAHLQGTKAYEVFNYTKPCGFLIGNEANGLTNESSSLADTLIRIPMSGQVESLNAAIAASILMFEVARQRRS